MSNKEMTDEFEKLVAKTAEMATKAAWDAIMQQAVYGEAHTLTSWKDGKLNVKVLTREEVMAIKPRLPHQQERLTPSPHQPSPAPGS